MIDLYKFELRQINTQRFKSQGTREGDRGEGLVLEDAGQNDICISSTRSTYRTAQK